MSSNLDFVNANKDLDNEELLMEVLRQAEMIDKLKRQREMLQGEIFARDKIIHGLKQRKD